ncbi:MAG: histidine kinase [Defluviitaleaceae bacterium]|nr:histidine kinase [Defluviitaleaceae bacterium]
MKDFTLPQRSFIICYIAALSLLGAYWLYSGDPMGFYITLFLACMGLIRLRLPSLGLTVVLDVAVCVIFFPYALVLSLFSAMYYHKFMAVLALGVFFVDINAGAMAFLGGLAGFFLRQWEKGHTLGQRGRDAEAGRYYELESLQRELLSATTQIERMTVVSERARIAREIHDNAGHEIVAAFMSLQTAREVLDGVICSKPEAEDVLALYDAALERLESGANRMRDAVHNLAPVAALGVESLQETCMRFPAANIEFNMFGDTANVPVHVWGVLEACLNEALTNAIRHAKPRTITAYLDTTPHIVRLCVENDGVVYKKNIMGQGLRNLRHRVAAVGGSLAVDTGEIFRVTCVVPITQYLATYDIKS